MRRILAPGLRRPDGGWSGTGPAAEVAGPAAGPRSQTRASGFTLIEILVVILLIVIVLGMVGLSIGRDESRAVRDEAERLSAVLNGVREEAIMQAQIVAVRFDANAYVFERLNQERKFEDIEGDSLMRARELPPEMEFSVVSLDGQPARRRARVVFFPTGATQSAFAVTLRQGAAVWRVEGGLDGVIRPVAPAAS